MPMNGLFLETERCPDGVELERGNVEMTDFQHETTYDEFVERFRARSDRRQPIGLEFQNLENPVVVEFVNAREESELARFFSRFGWDLSDARSTQAGFRRVSELWSSPGICSHLAERISQLARRSGRFQCARRLAGNKQLVRICRHPTRARVRSFREGGTPRMLLKCSSLTNFMKMEIAMAAMHGAKLATCERCSAVFLTGPLTGRRSHAKYCSDRCRVAAMRARNKGGSDVNS